MTAERQVRHIMICKLKPGADPADVVRGVADFANAPGVIDYSAGYPVDTAHASADNDFDLGVILTFGSAEQLRAFEQSEVYQRVNDNVLKPSVERIVTYNATIELYDYGAETDEATSQRRAASLQLQRDIINRR